MSNQDYLAASERTEKKFPNGLDIALGENLQVHDLLSKFISIGKQLDALKKEIIYRKGVNFGQEIKRHLPTDPAEYLHAILGIAGETAELLENKRHTITGGKR